MTSARIPPLPRLRRHVLIVLSWLAMGIVLGSVQGWDLLAIAWFLCARPVLALLALVAALQGLVELYRGRRQYAVRRGCQLALPLVGIVALPMLGHVSQFVGLAAVGSSLRDSAWARLEEGAPHLASIRMGSFLLMGWGYVYDDSGEFQKPCGTQSNEWLRRAQVARVEYRCSMSVTPLVGPYYKWFDQ